MDTFREAHALYDIANVLGLTGGRRWMVCPLPMHRHYANTPSFSIFVSPDGVQRFKCHGNCGAQGDVIDLVGYMNVACYNPDNAEHVKIALGFLDQRFEISPPKIERRARLAPDEFEHYLPPTPEVVEYAEGRGLTQETLEDFYVGSYKNYMSMPTFERGILKGIKFRNVCEGNRYWQAKGSRKGLFNYDEVYNTRDPVLIVKGEIPAMLLTQEGFLACAPTGGEGSYVGTYFEILAWSDCRVVVGDNDARDKAKERAKQLHAYVQFPPGNYKDIDEWMLADANAVEVINSWICL